MSDEEVVVKIHPEGERPTAGLAPPEGITSVDTFAGKIQMKWMPEAAVSSLGLMPFFIEFLKTSGRFDEWVEECPLQYTSPNAPRKRDVLGTVLLAVLAGHWRYAHINALRGDGVNPELLGMSKVASEDSVRRALLGIKEEDGEKWMKRHLKASYEPLLEEPWALDMDSTVKPLYGHQEDAKPGYNPSKPTKAHIVIFYDRVQQAAHPDLIPCLLAHVLVHEITHILQGFSRHSDQGVMKASWDGSDYSAMAWKPLAFAREDIDLIHLGLAARAARAALPRLAANAEIVTLTAQ